MHGHAERRCEVDLVIPQRKLFGESPVVEVLPESQTRAVEACIVLHYILVYDSNHLDFPIPRRRHKKQTDQKLTA